jgi:hypothetical protein
VIKLTQTYTPNLLNETGIFYSGNKITLTPTAGPGGTFLQPSGWTATSFFPTSDACSQRYAGDRSAGLAVECAMERKLLSLEERVRRL